MDCKQEDGCREVGHGGHSSQSSQKSFLWQVAFELRCERQGREGYMKVQCECLGQRELLTPHPWAGNELDVFGGTRREQSSIQGTVEGDENEPEVMNEV